MTAYINATECRTRFGLTKREIGMLGIPVIENRGWGRTKYTVHLYPIDKVQALAESLARDPKRARRKAAARKAVQTKIANTRAALADLRFTIEWPETDDALMDWVMDALCARFDEPSPPGLNGVVAMLRHDGTNYDDLCTAVFGKVGGNDAYYDFREDVDNLILDALTKRYPEWIKSYSADTINYVRNAAQRARFEASL